MSGARLSLEGLRKRFGRDSRPALDGVDLRIEAGQILVILGTSGAGKTTLLRVVAGLDAADAGRIVMGERVLSDPEVRVPPDRRGIGMVFQHLELWPHMTVAENVAFGLPGRPRGRSAARNVVVCDLAERVGVAPLLGRSPATLSGGERQRVAIARTLAPAPGAMLYDEPLANLDPERRIDLRRLIRRLCHERGTTLLYVTHDAEEAMEIGDEIAVLHAGRVVDRGTPEALYRAPTSLAGARALGPLTVLPGRVEGTEVDTLLGRFEVAGEVPTARVLALVRPEAIGVGGTIEAEVVETRPRGAYWTFTALLNGTTIEGRTAKHLDVGQRVGLAVRGPVAVVAPEAES